METFYAVALNLMVFVGINHLSDSFHKRDYTTYKDLWIGTVFYLLGSFVVYTIKLW